MLNAPHVLLAHYPLKRSSAAIGFVHRTGLGVAGLGTVWQGAAWLGVARQDKECSIMRIATATLQSISPYSQSKFYDVPRVGTRASGTATETPKDYEIRTWRERCHTDATGRIVIPPMAFKNCLSEIAKYLSVQIPGKGKSTYTKHFEAGVMVLEGITLPITKDEVPGEWLYVPSDGRRGGSKRVPKCFPVISEWKGGVTFHILDDVINEETFMQHLKDAGNFIGIGRFRPRNNGYYGRFAVQSIAWG